MQPDIRYTAHGRSRCTQRNLSDADVQFVMDYGRHTWCAGALHVFLGRRDIPMSKAAACRFSHLEGTVLVFMRATDEPMLITAYRNRRGFKAIRSKAAYDRRAHMSDRAPRCNNRLTGSAYYVHPLS
jgi:hypothetical protein